MSAEEADTTDFAIKPNAKVIDILSKVCKETGAFEITSPIWLKNKEIVEYGEKELVSPSLDTFRKRFKKKYPGDPSDNKPILINSRSFFQKNIVTSFQLKNHPTEAEERLAGNFLSLFENYSLISCTIQSHSSNKTKIEKIVEDYKEFDFNKIVDEIKKSSLLTNFTKIRYFVQGRAISDQTKYLLIKLGTYCYLKRNDIGKAYGILLKIENKIVKEYSSTRKGKDKADSLLLLSIIIKYHIYRLHKEEQKNPYYKEVVNTIHDIIKRKDLSGPLCQDNKGSRLRW